jgi:hypothetical protein
MAILSSPKRQPAAEAGTRPGAAPLLMGLHARLGASPVVNVRLWRDLSLRGNL